MNLLAVEQLLDRLNEQQRTVAEIGPGPAAVVGVPGSGKTTALVARIARLVRDGLDPAYILAMTFTRAAAKELNTRLAQMGIAAGRVSTIHSLAHDIIKESAPGLLHGLILDETGFRLKMEVDRALGDLRRDRVIFRGQSPDLDGLKQFLCFAKAGGLCPVFGNPFSKNREGEEKLRELAIGFKHDTGGMTPIQLVSFFDSVEQRRAAAHLYDFDDMQLWAWMTLVTSAEARAKWSNRWSVVMVDEAQDSSPVQWDMARLVAGGQSRIEPELTVGMDAVPQRLMILGDSSQSLYSWRAAVPAWFVDYATDGRVAMLTLPVNYRSVPEICWLTSRIVDGEDWHLGGEIVPAGGDRDTFAISARMQIEGFKDMHDEACFHLDWFEKACGGDWTKGVILARLAMFLHIVEIECIRRGIPYEKRAGGGFADAQEVQDLLAYLRVAGGWDSNNKWLKRCIRRPFRYIPRAALQWADGVGNADYLGTLMEAPMLSSRQRRSLQALEETLESLEVLMRQGRDPATCLKHVIDDTMYMEWLKEQGGAVTIDASKLAVIDHLLALAACYKECGTMVAQIDQLTAGLKLGRESFQRKEGNRLVLSTIHRSKGLEWEYVGLADVAAGRFPWNKGYSRAEELRLLYVAVSRAKAHVNVSWTGDKSEHIDRLVRATKGITEGFNHCGNQQHSDSVEAL